MNLYTINSDASLGEEAYAPLSEERYERAHRLLCDAYQRITGRRVPGGAGEAAGSCPEGIEPGTFVPGSTLNKIQGASTRVGGSATSHPPQSEVGLPAKGGKCQGGERTEHSHPSVSRGIPLAETPPGSQPAWGMFGPEVDSGAAVAHPSTEAMEGVLMTDVFATSGEGTRRHPSPLSNGAGHGSGVSEDEDTPMTDVFTPATIMGDATEQVDTPTVDVNTTMSAWGTDMVDIEMVDAPMADEYTAMGDGIDQAMTAEYTVMAKTDAAVAEQDTAMVDVEMVDIDTVMAEMAMADVNQGDGANDAPSSAPNATLAEDTATVDVEMVDIDTAMAEMSIADVDQGDGDKKDAPSPTPEATAAGEVPATVGHDVIDSEIVAEMLRTAAGQSDGIEKDTPSLTSEATVSDENTDSAVSDQGDGDDAQKEALSSPLEATTMAEKEAAMIGFEAADLEAIVADVLQNAKEGDGIEDLMPSPYPVTPM